MRLKILLVILTVLIFSTSEYKSESYIVSFAGFSWTKSKSFEKDGKKVLLIGMSHVGVNSYYEEINNHFLKNYIPHKTLILDEGVSNNKKLIKNFSYSKIESIGGLSGQQNHPNLFEAPDSTRVRADVDFSDIDPQVVSELNRLFTLLEGLEKGDINLLQKTSIDQKAILDGLIVGRNEHLYSVFKNHDFFDMRIIPWGAAHLEDIESRLIRDGYKQEGEVKYFYTMNRTMLGIKLVYSMIVAMMK